MKTLYPVIISLDDVTIRPEEALVFTNLGFEVTQDHLDRAADLYASTIEQNYFDDLFNALLIANEDIQTGA